MESAVWTIIIYKVLPALNINYLFEIFRAGEAAYVFKRAKFNLQSESSPASAKKARVADPAISGKNIKPHTITLLVLPIAY